MNKVYKTNIDYSKSDDGGNYHSLGAFHTRPTINPSAFASGLIVGLVWKAPRE